MWFSKCKGGNVETLSFCIPLWLLGTAASVGFVMLVIILILSICLCRACKRTKKRISTEENNPEEANLHYAELQNLPGSSRGQCDGGPCASASAVQNSDYATVAELQGTMGAGCSEPMEDEGVGDEVKESQPCVEVE